DYMRRANERIFTRVHRRRSGMRLLPDEGDFVPAHSLHAFNNTVHPTFVLQHWTLFDVKFEHGREADMTGGMPSPIANSLQSVGEPDSVPICTGIRVGTIEYTSVDSGAHHGRRNARALFIGPVHNYDWRVCFIASTVKSPQ